MKREVSVIIPAYNRIELLKEAVESVLSQTYRGFELIVVDDGSTEDVKAALSSFGKEIVHLRHDERRGPSAARNSGIKASRSPFVAFLDSDDRFDRAKLEIQLKRMKEDPSRLISHTNEIWYRRGELLPQKKKHAKPAGHIFEKCLPLCVVSMSTVVARRELFDEIGLFDEELPCCEDYDLWLRASVTRPFLFIEEPLTIKDGGRPDQVSTIHRTGMDRYRIRSIAKLLESGRLSDSQRRFALAELAKKCQIYGKGCLKHGKEEEGNYYLELPSRFRRH